MSQKTSENLQEELLSQIPSKEMNSVEERELLGDEETDSTMTNVIGKLQIQKNPKEPKLS